MSDRSHPELSSATLGLISQLYSLAPIVEARVLKVQSGTRKIRMVVQIRPGDAQPMIARLSADPNATDARVRAASKIMECLTTFGVPVPRLVLSSGGQACLTIPFGGQRCLLTLETFLPGRPMQAIERDDVARIASTLALMHHAAESASLRVELASPVQTTAGVDDVLVSNAEWFFATVSAFGVSLSAERELRRVFRKACASVYEQIGSIETFAAQCDTIPPNILIDEGRLITGIVDFHLAGDIALVNDLTSVMAYIDHLLWSASDSKLAYRQEMRRLFLKTYVQSRPMGNGERRLLGPLAAITVPFVRMRLDSVVDVARGGQVEWASNEIASMQVESNDALSLSVG